MKRIPFFPVAVAADGVRLPSQRILLYGQQQQQQQAGQQQIGEQAGDMFGQLGSLLSGGGEAGAEAATQGFAKAAGPIGLALGAGAAVSGMINQATTDENGFAKTNTGSTIARSIGSALNPIGTITGGLSNLNRDDLNAGQKVMSFVPGLSALATRRADRKAQRDFRVKKLADEQQAGILANQQAGYQGVAYAAEGGKVPTRARRPLPTGNPEQAKAYYDKVIPTVANLLNSKYDESYVDPQTGKKCTANSCLSFATTVQEKATGTSQARVKGNLYNPEFTRTASEQGWERIPLDEAQPGDRLQYWNATGNAANGVDRQADVGGNQYIPNKYPSHMMLFGGWKGSDAEGRRNAVVYNDGHEFDAANRDVRGGVTDDSYVAYRFIGVNGQPTNNPAEAVAVKPSVKKQPAVAVRREGGALPLAVIAEGALHSEKHTLTEGDIGTHGIPIVGVDGIRRAELERDELTLPLATSQQIEDLRKQNDYLGIGKLVQQQITTSTIPSKRFKRRLGLGGQLSVEEPDLTHTMVMLDKEGKVQMPLLGGERIISREHTRDLVTQSLTAKTNQQLRKLGRRTAAIFNGHDRRAAKVGPPA
jgi:hypothetical protein